MAADQVAAMILAARELAAADGDPAWDRPLDSIAEADAAADDSAMKSFDAESALAKLAWRGFRIVPIYTKRAKAARRNALADERIEALRELREDPSKFAAACRMNDAYLMEHARWRRGDREMHVVLDQLVKVEPDARLDCARRTVLARFRSPLSDREFCRTAGLHQTQFTRHWNAYCDALAKRFSERGLQAPHVQHENPLPFDILLGLDHIAEALGRSVLWVEQHADELPIGLSLGVPCGSVESLKPYRERPDRRKSRTPWHKPIVLDFYDPPLHPTLPPTQSTHGPRRHVYNRARGDVLPVLASLVFKLADKDLGSLYCSVNPLLRPLAA